MSTSRTGPTDADGGSDRKAGTRWRSPLQPCPNCGDPAKGRFCPTCGQRKTLVQVSVGTIVGEVLKDELALNSALPRTLAGILFRPGFLTNEYIRGRVARYIPPLRLYLISSILFFLTLSFVGLRALDRAETAMRATAPAAAEPRDSVAAILNAHRAELAALDTAAMPAEAHDIVRQSLAETQAALRALGDTTTAVPRPRPAVQDGVVLPRGSLQPWAGNLLKAVRSGWLRRPLERKVAELGHLPQHEATRAFLRDMLGYAPHMMFVLLPVFALVLKLIYIRGSRFYAEHFVFALHTHAFFFLMFFIMLALPVGWIDTVLLLWMLLYVWLAMKRVYRQGWFRTTVKWWVLGWTYMIVLTFGLIGLVLSTLVIA